MRVGELVERLEALCGAYRHLWVWWAMGEEMLCVCGLEDVGEAPAHGASLYDGENWYRGAPPLEAPGAARPSRAARSAAEGANAKVRGEARTYSMQYAVPRSRFGELTDTLSQHAVEIGLHRVVELKFVGGGSSMHGFNAQGNVACANVLWKLLPDEREHLWAFERALVNIGAQPHYGKLHTINRSAELSDGLCGELLADG